MKPKPTNLYGLTKLKAEKIIKKFCKKEKIKCILLRYFNVVGVSNSKKIGPYKNYGQLFKVLAKQSITKNPKIFIYGKNHLTKDGSCVRDFIDINDLADIHNFILNKIKSLKNGTIINCGYNKGFSVLEIIKKFNKFSKKNFKIVIKKKRYNEISSIFAINSVLIKLRWRPKYDDINKTVKNCINWEKRINKFN